MRRLPIKGLWRASRATNLHPTLSHHGCRVDIFYDTQSRLVKAFDRCDAQGYTWNNAMKTVIHVCTTRQRMTMREIEYLTVQAVCLSRGAYTPPGNIRRG